MKYKKYIKMIITRKHHIAWLNKYIKSYKKDLISLVLINILMPVIAISSAVISKYLIDFAFAKDTDTFVKLILLFIVVQFIGLIIGSLNSFINTRLNQNLSNHFQYHFLEKYFHIDWLQISQHATGDITTRLTSDVRNIVNYYTVFLPSVITLFIEFTLSFAILIWFDPWLAVFGFILGPLIAFLSLTWGHKIKRIQNEIQTNEAGYRSYYIEAIKNNIIVKTFNSDQIILSKVKYFQNHKFQLALQKNFKIILANLIIGSGTRLSLVTAFSWGAFRIASGAISFGTFTAFLQLFSKVQYPLLNLSKLMPQFISTLTSIDRFQEIESYSIEELAPYDQTINGPLGIEIEDIGFSYQNDQPIFIKSSLTINPGDFISIVGPSGIGKTTLMRLVLELVKPKQGKIQVFNSNRTITSSRSYYAYVPQGNTLFSGTIKDNLLIANSNATINQIEQALELACAKSFVNELPQRLDTQIGEGALGLSEGQAQRICIARAILRNKPILLLDESTSALDQNLESQIIHNIKTKLSNTTCILITHRNEILSTLDHVYELKNNQFTKKEL